MIEIRKNNLPYYMPYSIINTHNNTIIGNYKDYKTAKEALDKINLDHKKNKDKIKNEDPIRLLEKRIQNPDGDKPPKEMKRKVVLD